MAKKAPTASFFARLPGYGVALRPAEHSHYRTCTCVTPLLAFPRKAGGAGRRE